MIIKHKDLLPPARAVSTELYATTRFLVREDGVGLTLTDIELAPGVAATYGYRHHVEVAYCIAGRATLTELEGGAVHEIRAGSLWAARKGERFSFVAHEPTRLVCVFTPALVGPEVNDAEGSFPLLDDRGQVVAP